MTFKFETSTPTGRIKAPSSKSISHRMLIGAALAGNSTINDILLCDDTAATLDSLKVLGAEYKSQNGNISFFKKPRYDEKCRHFFCGESASTLRFMIPIALVYGEKAIIECKPDLIKRGVGIYEELFAEKGIIIEKKENIITLDGKLISGEYELKGNVSSQFTTGLMMALSLLDGDSIIKVIPPVESRPYIDLTVSVLKKFGIIINETQKNVFYIKGGQIYKMVSESVEGDWSNAAFLSVFNYLGGNIEITGLDYNSFQGDKVCNEYFSRLDKDYSIIDISDHPDLGPILFAFAAVKNGGKFIGTKRLKIKESDRVSAMSEELKKFGIDTEIDENSFIICKGELKRPSQRLYGHNDHRIIMALSVLLSITSGEICGAEAVNKSYPHFFDDLKNLGIKIFISNDEEL